MVTLRTKLEAMAQRAANLSLARAKEMKMEKNVNARKMSGKMIVLYVHGVSMETNASNAQTTSIFIKDSVSMNAHKEQLLWEQLKSAESVNNCINIENPVYLQPPYMVFFVGFVFWGK